MSVVTRNLRPESPHYLMMDALRFAAALGVVIYHYRGTIQLDSARAVMDVLFANAFQLVDLFFVLSGFIIAAVYGQRLRTAGEFWSFMVKRFARLWPLHVLLLGAYLAIWMASAAADIPLASPDKYRLDCVVPNLLMAHAFGTCPNNTFNYVSWSISAEMGMYLIAPGLLFIARRFAAALAVAALSVAVALEILAPAGRPWELWTADFGVLRAVPAFALGVALFFLRARLPVVPLPRIWLAGSIVLFFVLPLIWTGVPLFVSWLVVCAVCVLAAICDASGGVGPPARAMANMSPLTYGL